MAAQLAARGIQPGGEDAANAVVHVRAAVSPVKAGGVEAVQIQIRWTVVDREGRVLGTVNQNNQTPLSAIDAGLASLAPDAAGAAADAIADLARKAQTGKT